MKLKFTFLFLSFFSLTTALMAQTEGDYQSNVTTPVGAWELASNWQRFTGGAWVAASTAPSSTDGVITIRNGDSLELTQTRTIDQVRIDFGGGLAIYNLDAATTFTLADGPEAGDITVNGRFTVSRGATLTGPGTILVNAGGEMMHRRLGVLDVLTTIDPSARMYFDEAPRLRSTITNNGMLTVLNTGDVDFDDATIINNGIFNSTGAAVLVLNNVSGTNLIQNTATGVIRRDITDNFLSVRVPLQNAGLIQGIGEIVLHNIVSNTGTVAPGNPIGSLLINNEALGTGTPTTPTIAIHIESSTTPGTGHDELIIAGTTNLSGVTLTVTENPSAPNGTYTIIRKTTGLFINNFAAVNLPPHYSLIFSNNLVQVQKFNATLPLTWGTFTAVAKKNTVALNWSTLQESNTSLFVIEHSTNGRDFTTVTTLGAAGNSSTTSRYAAMHNSPTLNGTNYYRVKQVDIDGRSTYSKTIPVQFKDTRVVLVQALPNPVIGDLQLSVQGKNVDVIITNASGATVRNMRLAEGQHPVNFSGLPSGVYHLSIYQDKKYVETQRIVKQ